MSREKKFTRKRFYGFMENTISGMVSVPCSEHVKIGSAACKGACDYFCEHNKEEQYVICSKKPEMLDILERLLMYYDHGDLFPEEKYKIDAAKSAIKKAYGETE